MKTLKIFSFCTITLLGIFLLTNTLKAQHQHGDHSKTEMKKNVEKVENIVREDEPIDLKVIDKNNDNKLYQDQMDWNVISDKPGKCPLCGMNLVEVTLALAKENLIKHEYKVKEE